MFSPKNQKAMHSSAFNPLASWPTVSPAPLQVHDSSFERRSRSPAPATCIWLRSEAISNDLRIRRPWFTNGADVMRDKEPGTMRARQREQRERGVPVSKRLGEAEWEWGMLGRKPAVRLAHVTSGDGGNILLALSVSPLIPYPRASVKTHVKRFLLL